MKSEEGEHRIVARAAVDIRLFWGSRDMEKILQKSKAIL